MNEAVSATGRQEPSIRRTSAAEDLTLARLPLRDALIDAGRPPARAADRVPRTLDSVTRYQGPSWQECPDPLSRSRVVLQKAVVLGSRKDPSSLA